MSAKKAPTPPPEATRYPARNVWLASEANRSHLAAILADPVFLAAAHYAVEVNRVTKQDMLGPIPDQIVIRKAAIHAGSVEFIEELRNLTTLAAPRAAMPEPFEHIKPTPQ